MKVKEMTINNLQDYLQRLMNKGHTYESICETMVSGMMAAFSAMNNDDHNGGITGFQASWIGLKVMQKINYPSNKVGLRVLDFDKLLFPQYQDHFDKTISKETWEALQQQAKENLVERDNYVSGTVKAHWQSIVDGVVPFGFTIKED